MNNEEIKQAINSNKYDFLRTNEHLNDNIILLTVGGSHAYGTNHKNSDLDIRGIAIERPKEIIGLNNFEMFENKETDTVIYGLRKTISLLLNSSPNTLELLGTKDEQLYVINKHGKLLRDNKDIFISKKIVKSYGGFASSQLKRMERNLIDKSENSNVHMLKNALHAIRILQTGTELLEGKEFNVYRENNDFLHCIIDGEFSYDELVSKIEKENQKFSYAAENTSLPDNPDYKKAEEIQMSIYLDILKG